MIEAHELEHFTLCFSGSFPDSPWYEKWASKLIKSITKSRWSHVSFVYPDQGHVMCQEATMPRARIKRLYSWLKAPRHEWEIWEINNVGLEKYIQILDELWQTYGPVEYGKWQLIFAVFSYIFRTKNLMTKGIVCSEYVMKGIEKTRYKGYLSGFYDKDTISPQDIYQMVKLLEKIGIAQMLEKVENA